jgi:hypothetical protein
MKVRGGTIFALVLLFLFLGGLYLCMDWSVKARLFPLLIVVAGTGLSMWVGISEISRARSPEKKEDKPREDDLRAALRPAKQKATPKSEAIMMLWVLGFLSMILAFGFWVAIVVFTPLFMPLFGRENWSTVAIYTVGIWLTIYLVFGVCMKVPLYGGIFRLSW